MMKEKYLEIINIYHIAFFLAVFSNGHIFELNRAIKFARKHSLFN